MTKPSLTLNITLLQDEPETPHYHRWLNGSFLSTLGSCHFFLWGDDSNTARLEWKSAPRLGVPISLKGLIWEPGLWIWRAHQVPAVTQSYKVKLVCPSEKPGGPGSVLFPSLFRPTLQQKSGDGWCFSPRGFSLCSSLGSPGAQLGFNFVSLFASPPPLCSNLLGSCVFLCSSPITACFSVLPVWAPRPQLSFLSPSFSSLFLSVSLETGLVACLPSAAFFYEVEIRWHLIDRRSLHGYQSDRVLGRDTFSSLGLSDHSWEGRENKTSPIIFTHLHLSQKRQNANPGCGFTQLPSGLRPEVTERLVFS